MNVPYLDHGRESATVDRELERARGADDPPEQHIERSVTATLRILADIEHASPGSLYVAFERAFYGATLTQIADGLRTVSSTHTRMSVQQRCKVIVASIPALAPLMLPGRQPRRRRQSLDSQRIEKARRAICGI
jgi:hypothetical protein